MKCENCYHYEACLNSLSKNKVLNNTDVFACEHYKDKSLIVELPCRVGDDLYWISDENEVECQRNAIVGIVVEDGCFEALDIDGNIDKIGTRYAYLSREEAVRALEESEKNG